MEHARLLFIAPVSPAPTGNGLAMRAHLFLSAYATRYAVDLAVIPLAGAPLIEPAAARLSARTLLVPLGEPGSHAKLVMAVPDPAARLAAFESYGAPMMAARLSPAVRTALETFTRGVDYSAIHVSRLYLAHLARPWQGLPLIVDADEADGSVLRRLARLQRQRGEAVAADWSLVEARHHDAAATRSLPAFDLAFAASARETGRLRQLCPFLHTAVLPNPSTVARDATRLNRASPQPTILFVGTMGYLPNADAALWFARAILPRVCRLVRRPVRLMIVGRGPGPAVRKLARAGRIAVTGQVGTLAERYAQADLVVAPLRAGGGTRIKLLEAAAHRRPIVSTRLGAEGLPFRHERDLLLADTAEAFALACVRVLRSPALARRLTAHAVIAAAGPHDPARLATRILDLVEQSGKR